jgi:hypothetical protein
MISSNSNYLFPQSFAVNATAVDQAREIQPTNDTVLNIVVRNNPVPIWEM